MARRPIPNIGFLRELLRFVGETVTIYTTSGGESGMGFTGVLLDVNRDFVRLLTDIGPAPACALGSCCDVRSRRDDDYDDDDDFDFEMDFEEDEGNNRGRINCGFRNTGAVVDIPVNRIAAFVHNAL